MARDSAPDAALTSSGPAAKTSLVAETTLDSRQALKALDAGQGLDLGLGQALGFDARLDSAQDTDLDASSPQQEDEPLDEQTLPAWLLEDTLGAPRYPHAQLGALDPELDEEDAAAAAPLGRPPAPKINLAQLSTLDAWRMLVDHLRHSSAPMAATLEHAYLDAFEERMLSLSFTAQFYHFVQDERRIQPLKVSLEEIFGAQLKLQVRMREPHEPAQPSIPTLAQLREARNQARQERLYQATEQHPLVIKARELFGDVKLRVSVEVADR